MERVFFTFVQERLLCLEKEGNFYEFDKIALLGTFEANSFI